MISTRVKFLIAAIFLFVLAASAERQPVGMEMTTQSAKARAFFEEGLAKMETLHTQAALENWRHATEADPNFALAHIFLSYFAQDPTEQVAERGKALAARHLAGPEEQLIIDWLANGSKSQIVPAIQAMNEALERYQQDKHLAWLAGWWLMLAQDEPGKAIPMFERAIRLDPKFADPWNEVAYCYARTGNFDKAFEHIKRYTELLPHEANPQDSYAELSRMAGRYEDALAHYHASLKLDPTFIESQLGLGDTYALMGDEARARAEYAIAIKKGTKVQDVLWSLQSAATFVREGNFETADAAFKQVAKEARSYDFSNLEAEALRSLALYQKDWETSLTYLEKAETALRLSDRVPQALVDQEMAAVLRTEVDLAIQNGNTEAAAAKLKRLEKLANSNHDSVIQASFHGALGAMLLAQGKYEDAISHLEEDTRNPFSMRGLTVAYEKTGAKEKAARMTARLAGFNEPLIEQAIVVLPFRGNHAVAHLVSRTE